MIVGLPPRRVPIPGPLVDTGSTLVVVCEVATRVGEAFGDGDGDGDGEGKTEGDGDGAGGCGISWATAIGRIVSGCSLPLALNPR